MPEIKKQPITEDDREIFKSLLTEDHDFSCSYQCECGENIKIIEIEKPDRLVKCFDCLDL